MELNTAKVIVSELVNKSKKESESLQLCLDILNETFIPQFESITLAQQDADKARLALSEKEKEVIEKVAEISTLNSEIEVKVKTIETITTEKQAEIARAELAESNIETLQKEKEELAKSVDDATVVIADKEAKLIDLQTQLDSIVVIEPVVEEGTLPVAEAIK